MEDVKQEDTVRDLATSPVSPSHHRLGAQGGTRSPFWYIYFEIAEPRAGLGHKFHAAAAP